MSDAAEFLLVGGMADGRRVKLSGPDPYVSVVETPRRVAAIDICRPFNTDIALREERYARIPFAGGKDHRMYVYAAPLFSPADVLERLVERYPEDLAAYGQNARAWRAFAEMLSFVESGRLLYDLMTGWECTYGPMPAMVREKVDRVAEMIRANDRRRARG